MHQLTPELSELLSEVELVVFFDACHLFSALRISSTSSATGARVRNSLYRCASPCLKL
jgi:hypothetical protein